MEIRTFYAKPDMKIIKPILSKNGGLIIGNDSILTKNIIKTLKNENIQFIDIEHSTDVQEWEKMKKSDVIKKDMEVRFKYLDKSEIAQLIRKCATDHLIKVNEC